MTCDPGVEAMAWSENAISKVAAEGSVWYEGIPDTENPAGWQKTMAWLEGGDGVAKTQHVFGHPAALNNIVFILIFLLLVLLALFLLLHLAPIFFWKWGQAGEQDQSNS